MSFLKEHCSLFSVNEPKELEGFNCGDLDINEFFANDCFGFTKLMFQYSTKKTYEFDFLTDFYYFRIVK